MKHILKELDALKCSEYLKYEFENSLYFSNKISYDFDFNQGKFYTILPNKINPEYPNPNYYDFKTGGIIYPFEKPPALTWIQQVNESEDIIMASSLEYIQSNISHSICLEDSISKADSPRIKNSTYKYYMIENRIFYLIDKNFSSEEIKNDFNSSANYGFICIMLNIQGGLDSLNMHVGEELLETAKDKIFKSINSFYVEIYDNESYLIWVSNNDTSFLDIIRKNLGD